MLRYWSLAATVLALTALSIVPAAEGSEERVQLADQPAARDSFPHARHASVPCLACHATGSGHGQLTFSRPGGCAQCHHKQPQTAQCSTCHRPSEYGEPKAATVTINVPGRAPRPRDVSFAHERHASRACVTCHSTPVSLAPAPAMKTCVGCHTDHHAANRNCASCHRVEDPKRDHASVSTTHENCSACHTPSAISALTPSRSLCSVCHVDKASEHYRDRECTVCHFLATPEVYRARLNRAPPR